MKASDRNHGCRFKFVYFLIRLSEPYSRSTPEKAQLFGGEEILEGGGGGGGEGRREQVAAFTFRFSLFLYPPRNASYSGYPHHFFPRWYYIESHIIDLYLINPVSLLSTRYKN